MKKKKSTTKKKDKIEDDLKSLLKKMKPAHIRFITLYMGGEDGSCFNNATKAYLRAFEIDTPTIKVKQDKGDDDYTSAYKSARTNSSQLLTNTNIQKLRSLILLKSGFDIENIKTRYSELAYQNKNLPIAITATDRIAKIAGVISDDKKVDIPQLTELGDSLKALLTPKR